mmetsp:Transcript_17296/g.35407  ORF Transcript_17296/g.35407 Transcript_17296/m.35407 type:complete len:134 (-) Transcript_17296:171-572(-)|eukprot:CAMPEP_0196720122 /NCGR_PEP_ID=MMETSP1091-20130531/2960_1 /TAXON_ID=302021 /ORGANISM="Rhodomonas sp., Strain CCMP768" /LENGTH=133 /DNA_ID=CAMNT_0042061247 /DNA_START=91 /DNA_END=492 /DNA_ORIENTATION=+
MAFNNPSSRTPVSYGSATKALGYLARMVGSALSGEDDDENAALLSKKKASGENRFMVTACCCCIAILLAVVLGFVVALRYLANPHIIPKKFHRAGPLPPHVDRAAMHLRGRDSRNRQRSMATAVLDLPLEGRK